MQTIDARGDRKIAYNDLVKNGRLRETIAVSVPSRAALAGNPSDLAQSQGIGAVLSMPLWDFKATVALLPGRDFAVYSPKSAANTLFERAQILSRQGVGDWENTVDNTIATFERMLASVGREIDRIPVSIHLDTDIPRQRGMSGSSGMVIALLKALLIVHGLADHDAFRPHKLAEWALGIETSLGITAGLQDRVLQCYAGAVGDMDALFMDFSRKASDGSNYKPITSSAPLPKMALVLSSEPSHSGSAHADVKARIETGDTLVLREMQNLADYAYQASESLAKGDWGRVGELMALNAEGRLRIYGAESLGPVNIELMEACQRASCPANFTGSGGAMIALLPDGDESLARLKAEIGARYEVYAVN
jgi:glucuronokinase